MTITRKNYLTKEKNSMLSNNFNKNQEENFMNTMITTATEHDLSIFASALSMSSVTFLSSTTALVSESYGDRSVLVHFDQHERQIILANPDVIEDSLRTRIIKDAFDEDAEADDVYAFDFEVLENELYGFDPEALINLHSIMENCSLGAEEAWNVIMKIQSCSIFSLFTTLQRIALSGEDLADFGDDPFEYFTNYCD